MVLDMVMYDKIQKEVRTIAQQKHRLYGGHSLTLFNGMAILCRMNDKIQRLNNIFDKSEMEPLSKDEQETVEDTLRDLINYSTYMIMFRSGGIKD